ncbi:MAG: response regulator transcription factor [Burkholderiales bacterium]|nr:response regulator transcription factor [Burkholderiales bacterium]
MTTALVADDEPHLARALQAELAALWPGLELLPPARNGLEAAAAIARHRPDLAFLDIQMPGLTGLEVAQGIEGDTRVVFVTAYDAYAVQAFEQEAIDYVLKPVGRERLQRTVERVRRALPGGAATEGPQLLAALQRLLPAPAPAAERLRWVRASRGEITQQIAVEDVLYFHADEKYTCVRTAAAEALIRTPIAELAGRLDPAQFWQIHRSTIVNLAHLEGTRRDEASRLFVRIKGQPQELPVSRAYVHLFKAM